MNFKYRARFGDPAHSRHTLPLHNARWPQTVQQRYTRTMNLDNVMCLPLQYTAYAQSSFNLILDNDASSQKQLVKQMQNVCIAYACLAVKRNGGILGTDGKHKAAAQSYKDIAVPGFFRWARDHKIVLPTWLTVEKMGQATMKGAPILFTDGKKLWFRSDQAMREMKRDYNPIWDRYVRGQPGGNLPSGQTGHDAIEYLLDGLYARTAGSAERPVGEDELVEGACPRGGEKTGDEARGVGAPTDKQNDDTERWEEYNSGAAEKRQHAADGIDEGCDGIKNKPADGAGTEDSDGCAADLDGVSEQYPARPAKWTHQYLLTYCFIGRPSPSEDADLKTARRTSGPPKRPGKRKANTEPGVTNGHDDDFENELGSIEAGSGGNLDSATIRAFVGAGEVQSRAKVKRGIAAVHANMPRDRKIRKHEIVKLQNW